MEEKEIVAAINGRKMAAIVTGASSGIGRAVSLMLCSKGYEVFGIGRNFEKDDSEGIFPESFHKVVCDILNTEKLVENVSKIQSEYEIKVLVNNAGCGYYGLHEEMNPKKIKEMVRTNLEAPMILTQLLLRTLKKNSGYIINMSSVTAQKENPHGCAYGATKAGLTGFGRSLFEEVRKYGVKVVTIQPDMTNTNLYRNADFTVGDEDMSYIAPNEVADAIEHILDLRDGIVVTELTLRPQIHRIKRKTDKKWGYRTM